MKKILQKHTLFLNKGDYGRLGELYPESTPAEVIRALISNHIAKASPPVNTDQIMTGKINV